VADDDAKRQRAGVEHAPSSAGGVRPLFGRIDLHLVLESGEGSVRGHDEHGRAGPWATGDDFTLADCAALPALFYGDKVAPFAKRWSNLTAYFERLKVRPSVERVLVEAAPYMKMFPG
jgi:glutathione S-transferase